MPKVVVFLSSNSKTPFMWSRVAVGVWILFLGVTAGMLAHSAWIASGPAGHYRFLDLGVASHTMRASLRSRSDLGNRELTNGRKTGVSATVTIGLPGFLSSGLNTNIYEHNPRHTGA